MELKKVNASKNLAKAYFSHDWNTDLSLSVSSESPTEPSIPLSSYSTLESQLKSLQTSYESQKLDLETSNKIYQSNLKILKETIEKYKTYIEKLSKSNESKMRKLLIFQHFIKEYCKNSEVGEIEIDLDKELEQMNRIKTAKVLLTYEEKIKELCEKHENEIGKYQIKIKEMVELLKKEKSKSHKLSETAKKAIEYMKSKQNTENLIEKHQSEVIIHKIQPKRPKKNPNYSLLLNSIQDLKSDFSDFKQFVSKICEKFPLVITKIIKSSIESFNNKSYLNPEIQSKISDLLQEKKNLIDQIHQLTGNIRVFCRIRPLLSETESSCIENFDKKVIIHHPFMKTTKSWDFDHVFNETSTQETVFSEVKNLIASCFDGYNICIFTYGQTGSGKTYTLEGPTSNPGLIFNISQEVFKQKSQRLTWDYQISLSLLEVYNENLQDLLSDEKNPLKILNGRIINYKKIKILTFEQLQDLLNFGLSARAVGSTSLNHHSSRSHLIMTLHIKGKSGSIQMKGKIQLVDLAGSERLRKTGIAGETLNETKYINLSLHTLGNVINARQQKLPHVPFRNSVLTQVLQDCFVGNAKVLMIVQISPEKDNYEESVSSMNFASVARGTCLGAPKANLG